MYKYGAMYPNLEAEFARAGVKRVEIMRLLGINRTALYKKLIGVTNVTCSEMLSIQAYLELKTGKKQNLDYLFANKDTI